MKRHSLIEILNLLAISLWRQQRRNFESNLHINLSCVRGARGLNHAVLLAVLVAGLSIFVPLSLYSQSTAPIVFTGVQESVGSGVLGPYGVAVDEKGNVFISDSGHNQVLKVSANGTQATVLSSGLAFPSGLAVDTAGNLYIVDTNNSRILKLSPNGSQTTVGTGLNSPHGVAVDAAGNVFIADSGNGQVVEVSSSGSQKTLLGGLFYPFNLVVDRADNVFIGTLKGALELTASGSQITLGTVSNATGIAVDSAGNIFIADSANNVLVEIPAGGGKQTTVLTGLSLPEQLAIDPNGNIFIADDLNNRVLEFGSTNFGKLNVCPSGKTAPAPCSQTSNLNYHVKTATTIGAVKAVTQGATNLDFTVVSNTCKGTLAAGSSCSVTVKFAPLSPGVRMGAVQILSSGTTPSVLTATPIYGDGQGPAIAFGPGAQGTVGSGLSSPEGAAVDAIGDVFISDSLNNRVIEVPAGGGAQTAIATGLDFPNGLAVDGAGDVFIVDSGLVVEVPAGGGAQTTVASGLYGPYAVAVDGAGDVFVTDSGNFRVLEFPAGGGAPLTVATDVNGQGLAVDAQGDLFISDFNSNQVVKIPAGGGPKTTIGSGFSSPYGVAVDAAGDVFVGDFGNGRLVEVPADGGTQITLVSGLRDPSGVAVDSTGDVFVTSGNTLLEVHRSQPPTLSFISGVGNASYSQQLTVSNIGNQPLNAVSPGLTIGTDFAQMPGTHSPADCTAKFSLVAGASCKVNLTFTPPALGSVSSKLVLTDNSLNAAAATQTVTLNGTGQALLTPMVKVSGGPLFYTGQPQSATCIATGAGGVAVSGSCSLTYNGSASAPTNPGTYNVTATFTSASPYYGNATGTEQLTIDRTLLFISANDIIYLQGRRSRH